MAQGPANASSPQPKPGLQPSSVPPTRVRNGVVGFAVALSMITYIDRVALSNARKQVATSLHLSDAEMGLVSTAFAVAYALFEIPSGFMGDRLGPRNVLIRITIWWSIFTAVTGRAWFFFFFWFLLFLFGAGVAGCF